MKSFRWIVFLIALSVSMSDAGEYEFSSIWIPEKYFLTDEEIANYPNDWPPKWATQGYLDSLKDDSWYNACENYWVSSHLTRVDTSVAAEQNLSTGGGAVCIELWQKADNDSITQRFVRALRDEFRLRQECGILNYSMSPSATDSVIDHIILEVMQGGDSSRSVSHRYYNHLCIEHDLPDKDAASLLYDSGLFGPGDDVITLLSKSSSAIRPSTISGNRFLVRSATGTYQVPGTLIGKSYTLFDLTGKVVRQGVLAKTLFKGTNQPSVIKIQGLEPELLP